MTEQVTSQGSNSLRWTIQRPLSEPVLESAERELGSQQTQSGQATEQPRSTMTGNGIDRKGWQAWNQMREQLSRQVSQQPGRSALLALGAGAIAALLVSRILGRKRGQS